MSFQPTPRADHARAPTSSQRGQLIRQSSQLPVTALSFASLASRPLLLAAEDTAVKIYDAESLDVIAHVPIFAEQTVHGISVCGERVLVWGNKYVAFFRLDDLDRKEEIEILRVDAPDWVYDGKISPLDASVALLATAHNEVIKVSMDESTRVMSIEEVISPARPILYSAEVTWLDHTSALVAAGTAFGEILVWKCHLTESAKTHEMLHVFTGHEGSIYGVCISPLLPLPGRTEEVRLLASCSDDRTIRIWDITDREARSQKYDFSSARETGFSEILPNADQPKLEGGEPVATGMGHLSRIWGVEMGQIGEDGEMDVWSFGEDSTTWRWRLSFEGSREVVKGDLRCEKVLSYHDGKHLWSHASGIVNGRGLLATGGADGRISLTQMSPESSAMVTFDCKELCPDAVTTTKTKKAEILGRFEFIAEDQILVTTSTGRLLLGTYTDDDLAWSPIATGDLEGEVRQCYVLKRITAGTAILGTTTGNIHIFKSNTISLVANFARKIVDINVLTTTDLLIHTFGSACPHYIRLNDQTGEILSKETISGLDERFICTSASLVGSSLVLGSRHGWISHFEYQNGAYTQTQTVLSPTRDAITCITPLPTKDSQTSFLATSRDGSYRIYTLSLHLLSHTTLPLGPMIESAFFTTPTPTPTSAHTSTQPHLIITGFRGTNFVVWNDTLREERLSVDCGGAHRSFAFYHDFTDDGVLRFVFNRAAKLGLYSQKGTSGRCVKRGTHGREIRSLSFDGRYLATGGEDTNIRIHEGHPQSRCLAVLKGHVSGLQKVKWLPRSTDFQSSGSQSSESHLLFSSAGMEEFFVWRVKPLERTTYPGLAVTREAVFEDKSADGDLRIMDFDLERLPTDKDEWDGVLITMVFSSSALARYTYHPHKGFTPVARGQYTGSCLTQVKHLTTSTVLTASTDGHLALWNIDDKELTLGQTLRVHQSAVKCLDIVEIEAGEGTYLVSGGDDNALGIMRLRKSRLEYVGLVRKAHAASINGLLTRVVTEENGGRGVEVTTVSNDQRVKTWLFTLQKDHNLQEQGTVGSYADTGRIRLLQDVYSGVADPGDVEGLGEGTVAVAGVGVEVWGGRAE